MNKSVVSFWIINAYMIYLYFKGSFNNTHEKKKERKRNSTKILHRCHNKIWKEILTQRTAAGQQINQFKQNYQTPFTYARKSPQHSFTIGTGTEMWRG